jgi:hypothetical protein
MEEFPNRNTTGWRTCVLGFHLNIRYVDIVQLACHGWGHPSSRKE